MMGPGHGWPRSPVRRIAGQGQYSEGCAALLHDVRRAHRSSPQSPRAAPRTGSITIIAEFLTHAVTRISVGMRTPSNHARGHHEQAGPATLSRRQRGRRRDRHDRMRAAGSDARPAKAAAPACGSRLRSGSKSRQRNRHGVEDPAFKKQLLTFPEADLMPSWPAANHAMMVNRTFTAMQTGRGLAGRMFPIRAERLLLTTSLAQYPPAGARNRRWC